MVRFIVAIVFSRLLPKPWIFFNSVEILKRHFVGHSNSDDMFNKGLTAHASRAIQGACSGFLSSYVRPMVIENLSRPANVISSAFAWLAFED